MRARYPCSGPSRLRGLAPHYVVVPGPVLCHFRGKCGSVVLPAPQWPPVVEDTASALCPGCSGWSCLTRSLLYSIACARSASFPRICIVFPPHASLFLCRPFAEFARILVAFSTPVTSDRPFWLDYFSRPVDVRFRPHNPLGESTRFGLWATSVTQFAFLCPIFSPPHVPCLAPQWASVASSPGRPSFYLNLIPLVGRIRRRCSVPWMFSPVFPSLVHGFFLCRSRALRSGLVLTAGSTCPSLCNCVSPSDTGRTPGPIAHYDRMGLSADVGLRSFRRLRPGAGRGCLADPPPHWFLCDRCISVSACRRRLLLAAPRPVSVAPLHYGRVCRSSAVAPGVFGRRCFSGRCSVVMAFLVGVSLPSLEPFRRASPAGLPIRVSAPVGGRFFVCALLRPPPGLHRRPSGLKTYGGATIVCLWRPPFICSASAGQCWHGVLDLAGLELGPFACLRPVVRLAAARPSR